MDVMNAAWGTMLDRDKVALNLTETHKTVQNIKARKGFVVHIADAKHVVEADYFGIASGNTEKEKFAKSGMIVSSEEDWKKFLHTAGHMYIVGSDHTCVGTAKDDYQSADQSRMLGSRSRFPTPGNLCHVGAVQ